MRAPRCELDQFLAIFDASQARGQKTAWNIMAPIAAEAAASHCEGNWKWHERLQARAYVMHHLVWDAVSDTLASNSGPVRIDRVVIERWESQPLPHAS